MACFFSVILDTPLSTFLTMFGYPPNNLHTQEMYTVLKKAEVRKATIRQAPGKEGQS